VSEPPSDPTDAEGPPQLGWIAPEVEDEFPELALVTVEVPCSVHRRSPPSVRHRLADLSNRMTGAHALQARQLPIPALHRAFFRQLGVDPDVVRPPFEEAVFRRLWKGGFVSAGMPYDALTIALVETGVGVWALDAEAVAGSLGVRPSVAGESCGGGRQEDALPVGQLVIADDERVLAPLFGEPGPAVRIGAQTRRAILYVLQAPGVSALPVQEALWTCRTLLRTA
jgi:DNA/RNA-binding domain of Phe-tRNA-synthetase-like protein